MKEEFKKALDKEGILVNKSPEIKEYKKLKNRCTKEVEQELPEDIFYVPKEVINMADTGNKTPEKPHPAPAPRPAPRPAPKPERKEAPPRPIPEHVEPEKPWPRKQG